uniref:Uncharacterized protein n=1 Tax=Pyxicephalus adspersus TaxID=30357 RepID=A0AAV3AS22_PYXAD|nr:TPA: hypothetical protein GDO54_011425 [Pyxicephalus adspersus]
MYTYNLLNDTMLFILISKNTDTVHKLVSKLFNLCIFFRKKSSIICTKCNSPFSISAAFAKRGLYTAILHFGVYTHQPLECTICLTLVLGLFCQYLTFQKIL